MGGGGANHSWLTDRSRYVAGMECKRKRFLTYHSGSHGYGYTRNTRPLEMVVGTFVHEALAEIIEAWKPTEQQIIDAINKAVKGFGEQAPFMALEYEHDDVITEQSYLIGGLVYAWTKIMLPVLQDEYELVSVEREEVWHPSADPRIGFMSKPDIVLKRLSDGELGVHDFKTAASVTESMVEEYSQSIQLAVGTMGVEQRLGTPVTHNVIHFLQKGSRSKGYDTDEKTYSLPKRQESPFCRVWKREGNPPLVEENWQPKFKYRGADGKMKTLSRKDYPRVNMWESGRDLFEWVDELFKDQRHVLDDMFVLAGPYPRQEGMIHHFTEEMVAEEQRWIESLWALSDTKLEETHPQFQSLLNMKFPRSYQCYGKFGKRCPMYKGCIENAGAQLSDMPDSYMIRVPHHEPEVEQMLARGITLPGAVAETEVLE